MQVQTKNHIVLETVCILLLTVCCLLPSIVLGQKMEPVIQLSFLKKADQSKHALVKISARDKENKLIPASNAHLNFYAKNSLLKQVITDEGGKAAINLPNDLPADTENYLSITAKIENDSLYEDAEETLQFKEVNLAIRFNPNDTARVIKATVTEAGSDGAEKPIPEIEVSFFVQRLFGWMPAAEEFIVNTNEEGEAAFALPKNIPGDTDGNLLIVARIDNSEEFGTVEINSTAPWGVPLMPEQNPFPRALWEPSAPLPLIFTFLIIFGGVWITYFFILFQLHKVNSDK